MKNRRKDLFYSFGNFSGGIVNYAMMTWYMFFYVDRLGLSPKYYGVAMTIYGIWNAINDPLMGVISDKTVSRWGRRKPYMLFGAIPLGVSLVLLFAPPSAFVSDQTKLFVYFTAAMCVYDTFFTMTMLAWSAALPEMYLDEQNRARVNVTSQILGVLGAMLATLGVEPIVNTFGYAAMAVIIGGVGIVTMLMSAWGVRERESNKSGGSLSLWKSFAATFTNKAFVICVLAVLLVEIGNVVATSAIAFYSQYVMKDDHGVMIILGAMFLSSIAFAPLVGWVCGKVGVKRTYILSAAIFGVGCLGYVFAPGIVTAAIVSACVGAGVGGIMIMPNMLYAEIIDEDQVKTGVRREGAFFGMNALVMRLSVVAQGFISGAILSNSGYVAKAVEQVPSAVLGLRLMVGAVPLVFSALAILVLLFYPIDRARLAGIQEIVRGMNSAAEGEAEMGAEA